KEKEERKMKKLERENKTLKAELGASEKELEQEREQHKLLLSKYKEFEKESVGNAEKSSESAELQATAKLKIDSLTKDCEDLETELIEYKRDNKQLEEEIDLTVEVMKELKDKNAEIIERVKASEKQIEALELNQDSLTNENDILPESLYKREQFIKELRDELDAEREKHKHLRSYSMLIMQEEGAANV